MNTKLAILILILALVLPAIACNKKDSSDGPIPGCTPQVYEYDSTGRMFNPCWP